MQLAAVVYAAKSSEDVHGSIPTQLEDGQAMAARQGWEVVGEFSDEAFSAYHGNRGPGLERAKALAARMAAERGRCVLVAQDADRFARGAGDAPGAADHLGEVYFALKRRRVELWTVRSGHLDLLRATLEGERSTSESARKSQSVTAGLRRRAERGQPVGALPIGYTVGWPVAIERARSNQPPPPTSLRILDPERAPIVRRMFDLAEQGSTPGEVSRKLNTDGVTTARGNTWTTRAVRTVLRNADYTGINGYPELITAEQFEAVQLALTERRRTWDATPRRPAGRPAAPDFLLASMAVCWHCGAAMRSRRCSTTGRRTYRCANAMEGRRLCIESAPVDAVEAEAQVLRSITYSGRKLEAFLRQQVTQAQGEQREREAGIDGLREQADKLGRRREQRMAELEEVGITPLGLEVIQRIDAEREQMATRIADAEAVLAEWTASVDLDVVRALYGEVLEFVRGRVAEVAGSAELAATLRRLLDTVHLGRVDGVVVSLASVRLVEIDLERLQTLVQRPDFRVIRQALPLPMPTDSTPAVRRPWTPQRRNPASMPLVLIPGPEEPER